MYLGVLVSDLMPKTLEEGLRWAKDMGYTHVEIGAYDIEGTGDRPGIFGTFKATDVEQVRQLTDSMRLKISSFQCHVGYLFAEHKEWQRRVDHTKHMIDLAAHINVSVVHTVTGSLPPDVEEDKGWAMLVEAYNAILDHAAGSPVKVGMEPVFVFLVGNYATAKRLFDMLNREDLYINFDPSHFPYHREPPIPFIKDFGAKIIHSHVKDAQVGPHKSEELEKRIAFDMGRDEQFKFVPPGKGVLNWPEILAALRSVGYDDVLSLELGHGIPEALRFAKENVEFFKGLLG